MNLIWTCLLRNLEYTKNVLGEVLRENVIGSLNNKMKDIHIISNPMSQTSTVFDFSFANTTLCMKSCIQHFNLDPKQAAAFMLFALHLC